MISVPQSQNDDSMLRVVDGHMEIFCLACLVFEIQQWAHFEDTGHDNALQEIDCNQCDWRAPETDVAARAVRVVDGQKEWQTDLLLPGWHRQHQISGGVAFHWPPLQEDV